MTDQIDIHGVCAPGFEAVREAFAANFTAAPEGLDEQAARFSVLVEGEAVVDLWAGYADTARTIRSPTRPWPRCSRPARR